MAEQTENTEIQAQFSPLAISLAANADKIVASLNEAQGDEVDLGGYYLPDPVAVANVMRPCALFNEALASL